MKSITVSRQTQPATFRTCKNLGELIAIVEKQGENEGYYVTQFYLNGSKMDSDEESLLDNLSISEVETLEVQMATIEEIIKSSIAEIITCIQSVQMLAIRLCGEMRAAGQLDDEKVKYILIQCRTVIDSLEEIFVAHNQERFHIKHHSLWHEAEKEMTNILQCILQSRRMSDTHFVCDLIEYDLVHALDQWEEVLEKELIENPNFSGIFSLKTSGQKSDNEVDA